MEYWVIAVWFVVALMALVIELQTTELVSAWFIVGAFCSMIVSAIWPKQYVAQIVTFVIVSIIALLVLRPVLTKKLKLNEKSPADSINTMIGYKGFAESDVNEDGGHVNINGTSWEAVSDEVISKGEKVIVVEEKNITLKVKKVKGEL
ncbi:MAG: NfeD family protein [Acholeplasmatales bacterium]|nr:NfeD family protein [Acholeplasmatales bacterium]